MLNNQSKENVETEERNNEIEYLDDGIFFSNENDDFLSREEVEEIKEEKERIDEILSSISIKSFKNFFAFKISKLCHEGKVSVELLVNFFGINEDHNIENSSISMADGSTVSDPNNVVRAEQIISIYVPVINFETSEVTINGLVKAPGKYNVPIGTTLDTLYQIAGGLDDAADIKSIIMTRESIKQSEQLALESSKKLTDTIFST